MSSAMPAIFWPRSRAHPVVVVGVVADVAGDVGLLEAADAVLQARRAGHGPGPGERLRVAVVGLEASLASVRFGTAMSGRSASVGDLPRLGAVGQEAVGQETTGVMYRSAMRHASMA